MAKASPLPDWAKVGARFVLHGRWGNGSEVYTITRVSETSAWAVPDGTNRRESRFVDGGSTYSVDRDNPEPNGLTLYGADRWSRSWGHWVESKAGKAALAEAEESARRRRIRAAFDNLYKNWQRKDALILAQRLQAWFDAHPEGDPDAKE